MKTKNLIVLSASLLAALSTSAQTTKEEALSPITRTAGVYHSYDYTPAQETPAPGEYTPFYISHYGRHGSRRHTSAKLYENMAKLMEDAHNAGALTPKGERMYGQVKILADDAKDRYGDLTPRGVAEHRGIAERMYRAYPQVFSTAGGRERYIESRSTLVPRCILSMAAFNERLKELNPALKMTRESSQRYTNYLSEFPFQDKIWNQTRQYTDSLSRTRLDPGRLIASVFSDKDFVAENVKDPYRFLIDTYMLASITQDVDYLGTDMYDLLTPDELFAIWEGINLNMYLTSGPSPMYGDSVLSNARPLLRNIVESADSAIATGNPAATLRFGHDVNITVLAALMGLEGMTGREADPAKLYTAWSNFLTSPMAANLQIVFFRGRNDDDILVKFLYNEKERRLPIESDLAPYYRWKEVRRYFEDILSA